jgi:hypothetical protein
VVSATVPFRSVRQLLIRSEKEHMKSFHTVLGVAVLALSVPASLAEPGRNERPLQVRSWRERPFRFMGIALTPPRAKAGQQVQVRLAMTAPAPQGGAEVSLKSTHPRLLRLPGKVRVPAGAMTLDLSVAPGTVQEPTAVTLTGSSTHTRHSSRVIVARTATLLIEP